MEMRRQASFCSLLHCDHNLSDAVVRDLRDRVHRVSWLRKLVRFSLLLGPTHVTLASGLVLDVMFGKLSELLADDLL